MRVLTVSGFGLDDPTTIVDRITETLTNNGHDVDRLELATAGFDAFMTADERAAYHTDNPLITDEAVAAAELVRAAAGIVIAYPIVHGTAPARVKSFHERVFVLGVGFEFLPSGRITGALHNVKRACVVGVGSSPARTRTMSKRGRRNDFGPCLARSFYLSSNRGCKARYLGLGGDGASAIGKVERQLSGW